MTEITRRGLAAAALAAPVAAKAEAPAVWPDATETAARIRRGDITAAEAVETAIRRAEALQGRLNVLVNSDFERAMAKARGGAPGPFAGVPTLLKDLMDYRGLPTRFGSAARLSAPPASGQGAYATALNRTGLVVIGKSATPEFGLLPTTEPLVFGPTRNPWDPSRSPGGSSGGAAAAVAAGIVPVAHASDGGGSIRIPASCCGLFGLKPSRGRMVGTRSETTVADLSVNHVLSRSVRDSAALFAATEDSEAGSAFPPVGFVAAPGRRRLRIGYLATNALGHGPQPEVARALEEAANLVQGLGHRVEPTRWPVDGEAFAADFLLLWASKTRDIVQALGARQTQVEPFTWALAELARQAPEDALPAALDRLAAVALAYDTWLAANQFDLVMSPVVSSAPPPLGELSGAASLTVLGERLTEYVGYTPIHNVAGAPAMSAPLSWTPQGLPIGTMFAARAGREQTLFELAYQLEAARPWVGRIPPLHG